MAQQFASAHDAQMRLDGTICMWRGEPVTVRVDGDNETVRIHYLGHDVDDEPEAVKYTSPDFSYATPPLGYMYFRKKAYYVSRVPVRRQKQGLDVRSLHITPPIPAELYFYTGEFAKCIKGEHYTLPQAESMLHKKSSSVPVSRHIAIGWMNEQDEGMQFGGRKDNIIGLYYRSRLVGFKEAGQEFFSLVPSQEVTILERILQKQGIM